MPKKAKNKKGLRRLLEITLQERKKIFFSLSLTVLSAFLKLVQFFFLYQIIAELITKDFVVTQLSFLQIRTQAWLMVGTGIIYGLLRYLASRLAHTAAFSIIYELKLKLVQHLNQIPIGHFTNMTVGRLDKIILTDTEKIESFIAHHQADFIESILMMPLIIIYLMTVNPLMTLLSLIPLVIAILLLSVAMSRPENKQDQVELHDRLATMQTEVLEYIEGMNDIKCYDLGKEAMTNYRQAINNLSTIITKISRLFASRIGLYYALLNAPLMALLPFIIYRFQNNQINATFLSDYVLFVMVIPLFKDYLEKYFTMSKSFHEINEGVNRIDELLNMPLLQEPSVSQQPNRFDLHIKKVSFSYHQKQVLHDISFDIPEGKKIAIIGASGSGKTTIAKLLLKFLRPDQGEIYLGSLPYSSISSDELMTHMAFVFQESYLFKDSIWFNLTMGRPLNKELVKNVCVELNLHDKIMSLTNGYETIVGKEDGFFSGGEIQRLAVARVLLKDSKIIVLDEATAAADTENERDLQQAFQKLANHKTVIIIAHRLKTIRQADTILVLDNGQLIEQGTHQELLSLKGRYHYLNQLASQSEQLSLRGRSLSC